MRIVGLIFILFVTCSGGVFAQQKCATANYQLQRNTVQSTALQKQRIADFIQSHLNDKRTGANERPAETVIKIPVVVHIVYHFPEENIAGENIRKQIEALNRDYRRNNDDTVNTPLAFSSRAADCNIEFELAKVDPVGRATNGIERVYSPIEKWTMDDKVKSISTFGADAWDARYYLNIWICNLEDLLGYGTAPGDDLKNDGIVLSFLAVNNLNDGGPYSMGRTAVHEAGHWLGLRHLWGDADCGDDDIADTPKQTTYTPGCPSGIRISCNKSADGDMYMNFMDFTDDPCTNLFTKGQKDHMRVLFDQGGYRHSILSSKALGLPWSQQIPLPDDAPQWLNPQVYPNPVNNILTIDLRYDARWIGKELVIVNSSGQIILQQIITSKIERINTALLKPGIYFIRGKKEEERLSGKFIKL
jgi:hypothetical protein